MLFKAKTHKRRNSTGTNIIKLKPKHGEQSENIRQIRMALNSMCLSDLYAVIDIVNCNHKGKAKIPKRQRKVDLVESLLFLSPRIVADAINGVISSKRINLTLPTPYHAEEDDYEEYENDHDDEEFDDEYPEEDDYEGEDTDFDEEEPEEFYEDDDDSEDFDEEDDESEDYEDDEDESDQYDDKESDDEYDEEEDA